MSARPVAVRERFYNRTEEALALGRRPPGLAITEYDPLEGW